MNERKRAWLILIAGIVLFVVFELVEETPKSIGKIAVELVEDIPVILISAGAALLLGLGMRRS
jgi:hypothetical protein